eukprot:4907024-Lingulodinium_polyedra.AAC.1
MRCAITSHTRPVRTVCLVDDWGGGVQTSGSNGDAPWKVVLSDSAERASTFHLCGSVAPHCS